MPITVRHDTDDFAAQLTFQLAEEQARRAAEAKRAQQLAALRDLLVQRQSQAPPPGMFEQAAAPEMNGGGMAQPELSPADLLKLEMSREGNAQRQREAETDARAKRAAAFYASGNDLTTGRGDQALASVINSVLGNQGAGQRQQAALQAGLMEQQLGAGLDFRQDALRGNIQLRNELMSQELPPNIQEALDAGRMKHTRDQKREMQELMESISKADHDPSLTPEQRIAFQRQQAQRWSEINSSPHVVPRSEWPQTPQQMADQLYVKGPDGQWGTLETRNGTQRVVPWKSDQAEQEFKKQEFEYERLNKEESLRQQAIENEMELQYKREDKINDLQFKILDYQLKIEQANTRAEESGRPAIDTKEHKKALAQAQLRLDRLKAEMTPGQAAGSLASAGLGGATPIVGLPDTSAPTDPAAPPQSTQDTSQIIGPNAAGRYAKKHADGRLELLPEGFTP